MSALPTLEVKPLSNIAIIGGTHGNELVGIHLVRGWINNGSFINRRTFETHLNLSNPRAIEKCVRYIDTDLNRTFTKQTIKPDENVYEVQRAREIQLWVQEKNIKFVVDIHNTTSNMGVTLILTPATADSMLTLQIAAFIKEFFGFPVRVMSWKDSETKDRKRTGGGTTDLLEDGFGLEVGPLAHGTLKADLFEQTAKVVAKILDVIEDFNGGKELDAKELEVFEMKKVITYPRDANGNITAMIHSDLDGRDWGILKKGDAIFQTFNGETITWEEDEEVYPTFINEAAYLEKNTAFVCAKKVNLKLQAVRRTEV